VSLAGWGEIIFIALLTFVIVGPRDLPKVLFALGRFLRTLRRLSDEFMAEFSMLSQEDERDQNTRHQ
jgi:sec-independent protein translocase protein TatB